MSTAGNLLKGSLLRTLDLVVLVGVSFVMTPYVVHCLGNRMYGFWALVGTFMGYYGLLEFGMSSSAARYMSQAIGRGDMEELGRVSSASLLVFSGVAVAVAALTLVSVALCPALARAPGEAALFQKLLLIMGGATAVSFLSKVCLGLLMADIRYDLIAWISIGRTLLCNAGIYACLRLKGGIVSVALATMAANLLQYASLYVAVRLRFPGLRLSAMSAACERIRELIGYGSKTLVCQLGDLLRFRLDTVVIAFFLGAALVTPYSIGVRLVEGFAQLVLSSVGMMLPVFSQYEGRGDYAAIRSALLRVTKLATVLSVYIGASILFYGPAFIRRWMGPGYDASYVVAAILCAGFIIELPQSPGIQLLYGLSQHKVYAWLSVWEGLANLVLSLLFLHWWGIYGVALGTTAEFAIFKLFVQPRYICRAIALPVWTYLGETIFLTFLKTAAPLGACFLVLARFVSPSYRGLTACVAAQTAVFVPAALFFAIGREERELVGRAFAALLGRRRAAWQASAGS